MHMIVVPLVDASYGVNCLFVLWLDCGDFVVMIARMRGNRDRSTHPWYGIIVMGRKRDRTTRPW